MTEFLLSVGTMLYDDYNDNILFYFHHWVPDLGCKYFIDLCMVVYHGLCEALYSLDEGLICYSNCNTQTMLETTFQCFYILQPSEHGPMFLKVNPYHLFF